MGGIAPRPPIGGPPLARLFAIAYRQLIDSLVGEWEPGELHSEYRENLREMLEAKLAGEEIAMPEPVAEAPVVDLMEALKQSVAASRSRSGDGAKPARKKAAPRKRAAARK